MKSNNLILIDIFNAEKFLIAGNFLHEAASKEKNSDAIILKKALTAAKKKRDSNIISLQKRTLTAKMKSELSDIIKKTEFKPSKRALEVYYSVV